MSSLKINLDVNELIRLYQEEFKTIQDLSKIFNMNYGTIKLRLEKSGIKLRTTSESKKIVMNRPEVKQNVSEASKKSQSKRKETNLKKYGSEVPASGINWKDNYEKEHGVRHPNQKKEFREKMRGNNNPAKRDESKQKIKENRWENKNEEELNDIFQKTKNTWTENLGVDNPLKSELVKNKIRENSLNNNGINWPSKDKNIIEKIHKTRIENRLPEVEEKLKSLKLELLEDFFSITKIIKVKCLTCGNEFETVLDYVFHDHGLCKTCYPNNISKGERELQEFIKSFIPINYIIFNDRKILKGKELDIYIPNKNIAIEFDGIYYHSDKWGIDDKYHIYKTQLCLNQGIRLIHIFEDEWYFKRSIVETRLKHILNNHENKIKVHARKCIIKEISNIEKDPFLEKYHIQGKDSSIVKLGSFYNDELISVMTFSHGNISKGSRSKEGVWELNRFCSDSNYHIPGIASKLLSYFKKNYQWFEIFSYADRRWSDGNLYYQLGFHLEKITNPNYWYIDGLKRIHRFNLRKRPDEPKDIPEWKLRNSQGFYRVWDCGNFKFILLK